jgi:hypothetical protein
MSFLIRTQTTASGLTTRKGSTENTDRDNVYKLHGAWTSGDGPLPLGTSSSERFQPIRRDLLRGWVKIRPSMGPGSGDF